MSAVIPNPALAAWKTLVDGTSLNSAGAFANAWNYNYPWGNSHNGSARMYSTNITFSGGVATLKSVPVSGQGSIHYYSGTFYLKTNVTIDANHPVWDISVQAEVPRALATPDDEASAAQRRDSVAALTWANSALDHLAGWR